MCLGIPGRIESIEATHPMAREGAVSFGGTARRVNLSLTPEAAVGDFVLVHAGVAIARIDAEQARQIDQTLAQLLGEPEKS